MQDLLPDHRPALVLAPMQDITDLAFMGVVDSYGGPDYYVTEYFRVHCDSTLEKKILRSITENKTGKPVFAQMIGENIPALVRSAKQLMHYPVAGVDLNLGCPAPTVYKKNAGGGLLRLLDHVDAILGALRDAIDGRFTVKTRVGFETHEEFDAILQVFQKHAIDVLTIHGRTVREQYKTPVHADLVKQAVEVMGCPVIANGNVVNVATGQAYHAQTGAAGLMIGRGAIRSPWLFQQLKDAYEGKVPTAATRRDLHAYVTELYFAVAENAKDFVEHSHVNRMKKYMAYIAQGIDPEFEYQIRRVKSQAAFFETCDTFLLDSRELPDAPPEESKLFCGYKKLLE
ncbi:tRNA dihydrouridine synthase [Rubritalea tangerina]|uniref:tRNA-dihydrouridine synthase n=1 Tax=Rubritalea tangerina TaxID=430798 RepID=A0ABW4ZEV3_9BACT